MHRVQNFMLGGVSEFAQNVRDAGEGFAAVVGGELADIFQQHRGGFFRLGDAGDFKEQCPARVVKPPARADDGKGLARKTGAQQVVVRNRLGGNARDVAFGLRGKVCGVGAACVRVRVAGENASHSAFGGGDVKAADAAEEVDETPHGALPPSALQSRSANAAIAGKCRAYPGNIWSPPRSTMEEQPA